MWDGHTTFRASGLAGCQRSVCGCVSVRLLGRSSSGGSGLILPGTPMTRLCGGTSRLTRAPAAMKLPFPMRTPGRMTAPPPITTSSSMVAPVVGSVEIVCGCLVLLGLLTRPAVAGLLCVIGTAIATTKVPILLKSGFWAMEDPSRTDFSMLMCLLFLLIVGGGRWSLDRLLSRGQG